MKDKPEEMQTAAYSAFQKTLDYTLIVCLVGIFIWLMYLRRGRITFIEFIVIVSLLCHILWMLVKSHQYHGAFPRSVRETFSDSSLSGIAWQKIASLPVYMNETMYPTVEKLVKSMTKGDETKGGSDESEDIGLNQEYFENRKSKFPELFKTAEIDAVLLSELAKELDYGNTALNVFKTLDPFKYNEVLDRAQKLSATK